MVNLEPTVITNESERLLYQRTGAQVLRAECGGVPLTYASPIQEGPGRTVRGGIPVLFPQFGDRGSLRKHGWARDVAWTLVHEEATHTGCSLEMQLDVGEDNQSDWPHAALLNLSVRVEPRRLQVAMKVHNTGKSEFLWAGGLHPYWATADVLRSELTGLNGASVQDRYQPEHKSGSGQPLTWTGAPCECLFEGQQPIEFKTPDHTLQLSMTGFDQWMVWNPGQSGAMGIPDLPNEDWQRFVCIEPVIVDRQVTLRPGESFTGTLQVDLVCS